MGNRQEIPSRPAVPAHVNPNLLIPSRSRVPQARAASNQQPLDSSVEFLLEQYRATISGHRQPEKDSISCWEKPGDQTKDDISSKPNTAAAPDFAWNNTTDLVDGTSLRFGNWGFARESDWGFPPMNPHPILQTSPA